MRRADADMAAVTFLLRRDCPHASGAAPPLCSACIADAFEKFAEAQVREANEETALAVERSLNSPHAKLACAIIRGRAA